MTETVSGRSLATALGVSEKAVRKAVEAGRIKRAEDGRFDLAACRDAWNRSTDPARSRVRTGADLVAGPQVRTSGSAPLPQVDLDTLLDFIGTLPSLAAWNVALNGGGLQLAYDIAADMALDIGGDLRLRGLAPPPIVFEVVDWPGLAEEAGVAPIPSKVMRADWERRRAEG